MKPVDVPALVKRIRQKRGLTQEQLARLVGVTFSTVNQWENGHRTPLPFLLNRLHELDAGTDESGGSTGEKGGPA